MSTFVNDLRLEEIGTGEASGTWGTKTNVNLELIAEAMGHGTEAIANASTHTITMQDAVSDEFRCNFLRLTGGGQACTVTLAPNTLSHTWIMRNETNSTLTFTQGSGANVTITAGQTKVISTDGAGSGAVVYEMDDLELANNLNVGGNLDVDGTLETDALSINSTTVTSTAAELNILDGVTSTTAELNILDGVTSTTAELNILDGVTSTTAELNILDGVTSTTAELNILDGATVVVGEINALDLGDTAVGTAIASKAVILDANKDYTGIRNLTISGDVDVDGTIEFDALSGTGSISVTDIKDEDNMASNSATALSTQQSIKAYVDSQVATADSLTEVLTNGNTTTTDQKIQFRDSAIHISSSADGQLDIVADTEIQIAATTIDINGAINASGDIVVGGTVDGRDVATDGTKLDGIEASADVTDTANVTAAGALMDSELTAIASVKALNQGVATGDSPQFVGITSTANVIVGGNLTVNGTTTTINTATLDVKDKNITVNYGAGDTTGSANGAGLTIQDAVDASTDATILWDTTNDEFDFSHPINVAGKVTSTGTSVFASLDISGNVDIDGTLETDALSIASTAVTSTAAELNILDGVTSTTAELNILDGATVVVGEINALDLGSTAVGTAIASKAVILDSNKDYTGIRNLTISGELDAGSLDISGNVDIDGTLETDALSIASTAVTSTAAELNILDGVTSTTAELNILDGATVVVGEINALDLGSTAVGTAIASKAVILDSNKDYTGIRNLTISGELDAGSLDISGNVDIDGTLETDALSIASTAVTSTAAELNILDGATVVVGEINALDLGSTAVGTAIASKAVILDSNKDYTGIRNLTISGELDAGSLDISGNVDIDGTLETDALSIASTAVTSTAAELNILDGVTSTTAELNILDGATVVVGEINALDLGSTAVGTAIASKAVILDSNKDYTGIRNLTISGELDAGSLDISGNVDIDGTLETDALSIASTAVTSTAAELNILDGATVVVGEINALDLGSTAVGTAIASKAVILDSNKDYTGIRNLTISGELDAGSLDISGNVDIDGTLETDALSIASTAVTSTAAELNILDGATVVVGEINALDLGSTAVGTAIASKAVILDSNKDYTGIRNLTISGELDAGSLDISGNVDVDGTLETDNLTIGGEQGTDGQVLTSTGSGVAWEDASGGGLENEATVSTSLSIGSGVSNVGASNVVLGIDAGENNVGGDAARNTIVGAEAWHNGRAQADQTFIGYRAGYNSSQEGVTFQRANTAVGSQALFSYTSGQGSTAVGFKAAYSSTGSAYYDTVVGFEALYSNTQNGGNIAIGYQASYSQNGTSGSSQSTGSISIGYRAKRIATTVSVGAIVIGTQAGELGSDFGNYNVVLGYRAAQYLKRGRSNIIIGRQAGQNLTIDANSDTSNVIMGTYALSGGASGSSTAGNVVIGDRACQSNGTGNQINTVYIGMQAGRYATNTNDTSFDNVGVGVAALFAGLSHSCTGVGAYAGYQVTTANNCTFLGHDAGRTGSPGGAITTASNIMVLGNQNVSAAHIQVSLTVASDQRDKTDFTPLSLGLDFVTKLNPFTYRWDKRRNYITDTLETKDTNGKVEKIEDIDISEVDLNSITPDGTHKDPQLDIGFKAQDVQSLMEAEGYKIADKTNILVSQSGDGTMLGLQYDKFVPILVKAIQEQQTLIETLTARVTTLEGA